MSELKEYIGDGAYVDFNGHDIRIYTSDGVTETNEIFLERFVYEALKRFIDRVIDLKRGIE